MFFYRLSLIYEKKEKQLLFLHHTGKSALRLNCDNEIKDANAKTIDKYLYKIADGLIFQNIIIDEMSMVDLLKFKKLLENIDFTKSSFKRLILVGDQYQLPPIGYGKVFRDIVDFLSSNKDYNEYHTHLSQNCRQETDETILDLAAIYAGRNKNYECLLEKIQNLKDDGCLSPGLYISFWESPDELYSQVKKRILNLFPGKYDNLNIALNDIMGLSENGVPLKIGITSGLLNIDALQFISPYRTGFYGTRHFNEFIQVESKSKSKEMGNPYIFKEGDKVICISNTYEKGQLILANGSMGIAKSNKTFHFPESLEDLYKIEEEKLELGYAITVHKAQGSGFDHVFFIIPNREALLSRELVYTALTRSKKSVSLFVYSDSEGEKRIDLLDRIQESISCRSSKDIDI